MDFYSTLQEAIDAARELFLADHTSEGDPEITQLSLQKYVMQDGDTQWKAQFFSDDTHDEDEGDCLPLLFDDAARAVWDGDADPREVELEWSEENTLHEWDEGEFQLSPPTDTEEGLRAAEEWTDDDSESERW